MGWKEVAKNSELIVLEKDAKDGKVKIEARKVHNFGWEIFKTYVSKDKSNLLSEYSLDDEKQVKNLIELLKSENDKIPDNISYSSVPNVKVKRIYKEDYIEKWIFYLGNKSIKNFLIAKFDNNIKVDMVIHDRYRYYEEHIISQIEEKLGLVELGEIIDYEIYYFRKNIHNKKTKKNMDHNFIDIEFNFDDEDKSI